MKLIAKKHLRQDGTEAKRMKHRREKKKKSEKKKTRKET